MDFNIFKREIGIAKKIDDFLDKVSESGLIFQQGLESYLTGDLEIFQEKLDQITETEHQGDVMRRSLEEQLYSQTLIPESRGDVLELLEEMDSLLDRFKGGLWRFDIESPEISPEFHKDFLELSNCTVQSVEAMVRSARAFFKNVDVVSDHMHKVSFWETESDKISSKLQRAIYRQKQLRLSHRAQLSGLARAIDKVADRAEDAADRLGIFVIKRKL